MRMTVNDTRCQVFARSIDRDVGSWQLRTIGENVFDFAVTKQDSTFFDFAFIGTGPDRYTCDQD